MIAYLQKYDTTVEVPDDADESSLTDLNENFHSYVDQKPSGTQPESVPYNPEVQKFNDPPKPAEPPAPYKPNFYQSVLAPFKLMSGATDKLAAFSESNEGQAFGGKMVEGLSFGLMKPVLEHRLEAQYILNPDYAAAGQIVGDVGSLLMTGGAVKALGLGAKALEVGKMSTSVFAAGERFIPRAIMSAATFGTHSFIKNTIQAFEDGKVDLEQFGKDVLTNTAFGGILGAIGGIANAPTAVASAGGLGFLSSKMHGGDNQEAGLNAAVWAAFETVGSFGRSEQLRMEAINRLKDSMGEYAQAREPGLGEAQARQVAGDFVDHAMRKEGYENAEEIAKSGPENLLEGIEKVNQLVRRGLVPNVQPPGAAELPKLPAPVSPEAEQPAGAPAPAPAPTAVTPVQKAVDFVRGILGLPKAEPAAEAAPQITVKGDTYEEKIQSLKDQGHDISKMPESAFPDDMKDVYHFEQAKGQKAAVGQAVAEITGRLTDLGLKPEEQGAIFDQYGVGKATNLGQPGKLTDLVNTPIEEQYKNAYQALASQRGIEGDRINGRTMEDARKAVDLINGYFNPQSQMVFDFAKAHQDLSDHAVAQMAYDRGLIEEPNNDLLNVEIQKAKQEKIIQPGAGQGKVSASLAPQEPSQTPKDVPATAASAQSPGVAPEKLFPGPEDPSYRSITADPSYVNMRQKAAEIAHRYAQIEGVSLTPEYAQTLFNHIHDLFEPVKNPSVPLAQRMEAAKALQAKYPDIENAFLVMKDQAYSDKTGPAYFDRSVKGQRYLPEQPKTSYSIAGGGTVPRETTPRTPGAAKPAAAAEISSRLKEAATEITDIVIPTHGAPLAAQITRENLGKMARSYDMAEAALEGAKKFFDSRPKEANLDFIDKMERGAEISATERIPKSGGKEIQTLRDIADRLRKLLDDKRAEIQALGTGKMQSFIENYFPHIWDQGEKQVSQTVMKAAKRPLEGSKSFLKKRSIEFTKDGIEMGLTPVSYNPVDLALLKIREMDKYLMAHRTIQEYKKNGLAKYVKIGGEVPEGWTKIDDRVSTVFKSPMVAVKEAYDEKMMSDLNAVAKSIGIDLERSPRMKGEGKKMGDVWGLSMSDSAAPGKPGKIFTRFAGPESALAHELGHQLDHIYGLQAKFLSDPKIDRELTDLANQRISEVAKAKAATQKEYQGEGLAKASNAFKAYVQQPDEKMAAMLEAYIHAPELLKETAPNAYAKLNTFLKSDPKLAPLTEVKPSLVMGVNEGEVYAGGAVIAGHIYAQPDAARIINNYLSPGLQKSTVYQAWRYAGNIINQFQLGMSAFHLGFTSVDASVSKLALSLMKLSRGEPLSAIKDALKVPFAPITNFIRGDELLKSWRGQGKAGIDEVLAEVMASAGGRARMDQFYATRAWEQMKHHFEAGRIIRGALNIPMAIAEMSSKPILEYIVPRQKLGIFADMIQMELNSHPDITHSELRAISQRAWDSVDNRMGQLVYDNLFWNRTFKDLLMGSVRSVGWNQGTVRELGGGVVDSTQMLADLMRGKKSDVTYRTAYLMALPMLMGMVGAIAHYLMTGKGPSELKDYYYPKTGRLDANGLPERIAFPSYMKDIYHYTQAPVQTVLNKLHPSIAMMEQMWANKDYYGTKIRNEDDPVVQQIASEAMFVAKQSLPFSVRNMQKNLQNGNQDMLHTIGPWVGITPAPYDINQTKAEKLAHEIAASHQEIGGRTQEQVDRSRLVADLTRRYRLGDPEAANDAFKAYQAGRISHRQMQEVITNSRLTPLQRMVKPFTLQETERVYKAADDEEKSQIELILRRKEVNQKREFVTPDGNPAE